MSEFTSHDDYLTWCLARPGQSHYFEASGARIHYLEWQGPAQARTLVLVHGFTGHAHWWDFIAPALAENYRVLAMDLSGMGDSDYRAQYSMASYVEEISTLVRHANATPVTVIGHSFGGRCTILAAHDHPELIERIIVVDSHVGFADEERKRRFNREARRDKKRYADLANAKARFRLIPEQPLLPPRIFDHIATHSLKQDGDGWVWKFDEAVMARAPHRTITEEQALAVLKMPMEFVCGEHSVVAPLSHAKRVVSTAPHGRGPIVIPAAHHHVPIDQPLALTSVLRALLAL